MSHSPVVASSPALRSALVAMVRKRVPESDVEDIVQATLADAFASPHAPPDPESFRRWIFGVAKNKVVDFHRRRGRESFDVPEIAERPAPHAEVDMLRWAERNLPPGEENKTTLDWMLREGEGEKLESIAEAEKMPAPRVRQRVSRLRRHLKDHWKKEVALLATVGVLLTGLVFLLRHEPTPQPIANEDVPRAQELRKQAFEKCLGGAFQPCIEKLDEAKRLDPAGDTAPAVKQARDNADRALRLPPPGPTTSATTSDVTPVPPLAPKEARSITKDAPPAPAPKPTATALPSSWPTPLTTEQVAPPKTPPRQVQPKSSDATPSPDFAQSNAPSPTTPAKKKAAPPRKDNPDFGGSL